MKKLMIAAAIVCAAAFAQAASIDWNVTGKNAIKGYDGNNVGEGFDVYLVLSTYSSTIDTNLKAGTFTGSAADGVIDLRQTTSNSNIDPAVQSPNSTLLKAGTDYTYQCLILDEDADGNKYYKLTTASDPKAAYNPATDDPVQVSFAKADFTAGTWTKYADGVPEPTSGLLLLLGVAGLALRRRRA